MKLPLSSSSVFSHVPDKKQAWNDLLILTESGPFIPIFSRLSDRNSKYTDVRKEAAKALVSSFPHVLDKQKAWNRLIKLIVKLSSDKEYQLKDCADFLSSACSKMPDKQQAWDNLHKLTNDKDWQVKYIAASTIGYSFSSMPDKQQAWNDLYRLMNDTYLLIPVAAAALGSAFAYVPDKQNALNDLIKLTTSENSDVRRGTAYALGFAYSNVPDKQKLWNILIKLSSDQNRNVRNYTNHSLGKICIFQASQAEKDKDYKNKLETAIEFFEKASQESEPWSNPSQFCLPFYRSFHAIVFKRQQAKEEANKYLEEAKQAVQGSKNKELLFEAVNNLANAVKQVQNMGNMDLETKKGELGFYRKYCDNAAELMRETEKATPYATDVMIKGLPILDRNLKWLIEEIQEEAETAWLGSQGTATEEIACAVHREVQKWEIDSQEYLETQIESLIFLLKSYVPKMEENYLILNRIDKVLQEPDIVKQYTLLNNLIPQIMDIQVAKRTELVLKEIQELRDSVDRLIGSLDELQNPQEYLHVIQRHLEEIRYYIPEMKGKIDRVLDELYTPLSTTQKLKVAIPLIPLLVSYEMETDVPELVADSIYNLKNLVLRFKNK